MVISTVITAVGAHLLLGIDWQLALLLGAIVSSTDAAAVFSVLRVLPLPQRVAGLLEAESGFNDAPAVILVLMFSVMPFVFDPAEAVTVAVYELLAGAAIGLAVGYLGALALRRIALPASGLYPIGTFGLALVAFAAAGVAHASGFIAAYLAAVVLANSGLPHRSATRSFAEGLGWLAQIGLFVLLGLLVNPSELAGDVVACDRRRARTAARRPAAVGRGFARVVPHSLAPAGLFVVGRSARRGPHRAGDLSRCRGRSR